jgi:tetratricopeptide (TPR) repeat protein
MVFKFKGFTEIRKEVILRLPYRVLVAFLCSLILLTDGYAQQKRSIGILPFDNLSNQKKYDWIGFGIEYLLFNKLSNISALYVPDQAITRKALAEIGYNSKPITGEMVYHIGKSTGINLGITGNYLTNGKAIEVNLSFINAFNGATIFSKKYQNNFNELFQIIDDIAQNLIQVTTIQITPTEQNILNRQITSSIVAYESFCLGYIENEKTNRHLEIITGLFRRAIQQDPKFWEAYYNLGITYFNDRDYDNALKQFDIIITSIPTFEKPYYGRGMIYLHKEDYAKAKEDFIKVTEFNPNDFKAFYYLGKISVLLKQYDDANKYLKKAAEINPDYADVYYEMGNIYFQQQNYRAAIPHYKKTVELDPENRDSHERLGECYYRVQVYYSALAEFKKVLEKNPGDPEANFMLGITVYQQAVLEELITAFLEMFDPDYAKQQEAQQKAKGSLVERSTVYKQMVESFSKAYKGRDNFIEAIFNLALTYHEMGNLDSAQFYYKKALLVDPNLVRAHIKLAKLYEDRKDKDNALAEYKIVMSIDPAYFVAHPTLGPIHNYINIVDLVLSELDKKLKSNPNDLQSSLTLAKIYTAQGFNGKAANLFRKILSINPNDQEAKRMLAQLEKRSTDF